MIAARERSVVQFGRTRIAYDIRRSSRRSTVSVTVAPPGQVVLTAPATTPVERLDRVVLKKGQWIVSRLHRVRPLEPALPPREFVTGETFLYLGRQFRLLVRPGAPGVRLAEGRFVVQAKPGPPSEQPAVVRALLCDWYRRHAVARLEEQTRRWAVRLGVEAPSVRVRDQERRWGSCAAGVVRFNWRIIQAPVRLVDYVVVHELAHLCHDDHGRAFWSKVGQALPDYETRREALRHLGPRLQW